MGLGFIRGLRFRVNSSASEATWRVASQALRRAAPRRVPWPLFQGTHQGSEGLGLRVEGLALWGLGFRA